MKLSKELVIIFAIIITEVLGFSLILPFLPFYAQDLGATAFQVGLILSVFSIFQFLSAPIMGRLSDHYGRRPLLILSQLSTFLGFLVLGLANTLPLIYLARIIDGLFGSNFIIAQAYLSDISTKKDRSKIFGFSGMAFGIGFFIGPAIGGALSQISYSLPAFISAGIALITVFTTYFFLPETVKKNDKPIQITIIDFKAFKKYFANSKISIRLWQFFLFVSTHALWVSAFALFAERRLQFNAGQVGFLLTYLGLINILLRGPILPKLIDWMGEYRLLFIGITFIIISMFLSAFVTQIWLFYLLMGIFAIGNGISRPLILGEISRRVSPTEQGAIMGITGSLGSLSQIFAPLAGGLIIQYLAPGWLGISAAAIMTIALALMLSRSTRFKRLFA